MMASKPALSFFILAGCVTRAISNPNEHKRHCHANESSCNSAHGASLLQHSSVKSKTLLKRVKEDAEENSMTKYIAGVPVHNFHRVDAVESETTWILVLPQNSTDEQVHAFCSELGSNCSIEGHPTENGVPFIAAVATVTSLETILTAHSDVEFVEPDAIVYPIPEIEVSGQLVNVTTSNRPGAISATIGSRPSKLYSWGLDRIDDLKGLDGSYDGTSDWGRGVHAYVVDSGIYADHADFEGRAMPYLDMTIRNGQPTFCTNDGSDCGKDDGGHGTHCAGTLGGFYSGVAKGVQLYGVKVLKFSSVCNPAPGPCGAGSWVLGAVDQIVAQGNKPAVVSMSLGAPGFSNAYLRAIDSGTAAGVTFVVAAGNENRDACSFAPAHVGSAITVGATDEYDRRPEYSNYGTCVDISAPGSNIWSSAHNSPTGIVKQSGTSMSCPHVAGAAAILIAQQPSLTPAQVESTLVQRAGSTLISDTTQGSPNKLLYVMGAASATPRPTPYPTPLPTPSPTTWIEHAGNSFH